MYMDIRQGALSCDRVDTEQAIINFVDVVNADMPLPHHPHIVQSFPSDFGVIHVVERTVSCPRVSILDCRQQCLRKRATTQNPHLHCISI